MLATRLLLVALVSAASFSACATRGEGRERAGAPALAGALSPESPVSSLPDGSTIRGFQFEPCHPDCTSVTISWSAPGSRDTVRTPALRAGGRFGVDDAFVVERVRIVPRTMGNSRAVMAAILVEEATIRQRNGGPAYLLTADGVRNFVRKAD